MVWLQQQELRWTRGCWPFSNTLCCLCVGQMKGCIKVLKEQPSNSVEGLLNALRWVWKCVCVCFSSRGKDTRRRDACICLCCLLLQVYDTASKWWQHLQTNQGPPAMRKRRAEERGEERGRALEGGGKKKRRRKQAPVADKPVCLQRTKKTNSRLRKTCWY